MKKSIYHLYEKVSESHFLHYSSLTNSFVLLNEATHNIFENTLPNEIDIIKSVDPNLFQKLVDSKIIIENDFDEMQYVLDQRNKMMNNHELYNIVVNTTLDCNLDCWYCYESKIKGSRLTQEVINAIKNNIILHWENVNYTVLKLSFFGGEPFMYFEGIKQLLDFANDFCAARNIELIADFTTNATLITQEHINYLKQFQCHFQITLDGGRNSHNRIKVDKLTGVNTYDTTLETLRLIDAYIDRRWIAVRVNFDNRTLKDIDEIISNINFLDRRKSYIILKKVWQLKTENVDKDALMSAIQKFFDSKFLVDYYIMPKGCICFAERKNQVLFNYDGKIFKCTTISEFNENNSLGVLDLSTGRIDWDEAKMSKWLSDMQPDYCKSCKWFPACLGICNKQLMAHGEKKLCTFDACNLTEKEYLMYLFKYNLLKNEIYK